MTSLRYEPLDPQMLADPYPVYERLRERSPVFWHDGMGCWVLTRYADCVRVLRAPEVFARDWRRVGEEVPSENLSVQSLDPPEQAPLRGAFLRALHAQDLDAVAERARRFLDDLFGILADRGGFDLIGEVAEPLSLRVVCDLLGVAEPGLTSFAAVSDAIMRSMDAGLDPALAEPGRRARGELTALVASWFSQARRPGLLTDLDVDGASPWGEVFVANTMRVMFQGGYSTMVAAIGNLVHTLLRHPGVLGAVRSESSLTATAVEEIVRFDGPVQGTSRVAVTDTVLGGLPVAAGQTVLTFGGPTEPITNPQTSPFDVGLEMMLDGAQVLRLGRDLIINIAHDNHALAVDWLERHLAGRYQIHRVWRMADNHIDSMLLALRPGVLLARHEGLRDLLPTAFRSWKLIVAPEPSPDAFPVYDGDLLLTSPYIDLNVLSIDETTVLVNDACPGLAKTLEAEGFTIVPVRHRHRRLFGGGFHCFTLDTVRTGTCEDYLT
jgi:cytochrome P450